MTDVSAGFRPPCWCPCTWAPAWRLHTNLYKFGENVSSHIFHAKHCCDLNLGESLCICTFFLFPDSGLNLLNGFDFLFWSILNGVTLKTSNSLCKTAFKTCSIYFLHISPCAIFFSSFAVQESFFLHCPTPVYPFQKIMVPNLSH